MTDIFSKKKRSEIMSKVKNKGSKIEVAFQKKLWAEGFRYRKNSAKYFGKPDIVLPKYQTVIFIDSCFWHGCKKHVTMPKTRKDFWVQKIERNKERDKEVSRYYKKNEWKIFRIWEHDLKKNSFNFDFKVITSCYVTEKDEIGMREHIDREVQRYRQFAYTVLGAETEFDKKNYEADIRKYAKYILANGSKDEKREVLGCLKTKLVVKGKEIFVN